MRSKIWLILFILFIAKPIPAKAGLFDPPDLSRLKDVREASQIFDERDEPIAQFCDYCREIISLDQMGKLPEAAVAAEDKHFWTRQGTLDWPGILRATYRNLKAWEIKEGASTITDQLANIIFLEEEKTDMPRWKYKLRKAFLAAVIEKEVEGKTLPEKRRKILELYLNNFYCGYGQRGASSCSLFYFGKTPAKLNYAETAMIIGLIRSPNNSSPFRNPDKALALRNRVLEQFAEADLIRQEEKLMLAQEPLPLPKSESESNPAPHFAEFVRRYASAKYAVSNHGLKIRTTFNLLWQKTASLALKKSLEAMKERNPKLDDLRGAVIMIDRRTGAIKVFAQEPSFKESEYLLDQIKRQCGSACKPFFYAKWLEKGGRLSCLDEGAGSCELDDSRDRGDGKSLLSLSMGKGRDPKNIQNFPYTGNLERYIGIAEPILCLAESRNACTMSGVAGVRNSRVVIKIAKEEIMEMAVRLGISFPTMDPKEAAGRDIAIISKETAENYDLPPYARDPGHTIAIGALEVSPFEMAVAFASLLTGKKIGPYAVEEIKDPKGNTLESANLQEGVEVLNPAVSLQITRGLRAVAEFKHGTGRRLKEELPRIEIMVKTGTATDGEGKTTDNWIAGCSPSYCAAVWIGRDKKLPMETVLPDGTKIQETGGRNALPVLAEVFRTVYQNQPKDSFPAATDPLKPFVLRENNEAGPRAKPTDEKPTEGNDF